MACRAIALVATGTAKHDSGGEEDDGCCKGSFASEQGARQGSGTRHALVAQHEISWNLSRLLWQPSGHDERSDACIMLEKDTSAG